MSEEVWKPIPDHDGYDASSLGRIRSFIKVLRSKTHKAFDCVVDRTTEPKVLKPQLTVHGYQFICISGLGRKMRCKTIHRLVARTFLGDPPHPRDVVRHLNDQRLDNRAVNLAYGTYKQNYQDSVRNGGGKRGVLHPGARLNPDSIAQIWKMLGEGVKPKVIAAKFSMSPGYIRSFRYGVTWKHLSKGTDQLIQENIALRIAIEQLAAVPQTDDCMIRISELSKKYLSEIVPTEIFPHRIQPPPPLEIPI